MTCVNQPFFWLAEAKSENSFDLPAAGEERVLEDGLAGKKNGGARKHGNGQGQGRRKENLAARKNKRKEKMEAREAIQ